jgi:hypothetical protein
MTNLAAHSWWARRLEQELLREWVSYPLHSPKLIRSTRQQARRYPRTHTRAIRIMARSSTKMTA